MQIFKLKLTNNKLVRFKKFELNKIMSIYSKKISIGEWKDYSTIFFIKFYYFKYPRYSFWNSNIVSSKDAAAFALPTTGSDKSAK